MDAEAATVILVGKLFTGFKTGTPTFGYENNSYGSSTCTRSCVKRVEILRTVHLAYFATQVAIGLDTIVQDERCFTKDGTNAENPDSW
jgi:hypothetical protein